MGPLTWGDDMETPSLPWCGILWGVQEAGYPAQCRTALTGGLLTRTPSHYPGPQPLCNLPPHPRPGRGKDGAWWAGAGPEEGARDSVTGRAGRRGRRGWRGQAERQPPTARLPAGGGWVPGWGLGLGEDVTARPGSYGKVPIKTQTKARSSLYLEMPPEQPWCLGLGWRPR